MKRNYTDLDVWKAGIFLCKDIYLVSSGFPSEEKFGLTNQIRRAAVSIPSNIAEGYGLHQVKESIQFFFIARGSIYEIETQLFIALELNFIDQENFDSLLLKLETTRKLLYRFIKHYQQLVK